MELNEEDGLILKNRRNKQYTFFENWVERNIDVITQQGTKEKQRSILYSIVRDSYFLNGHDLS